MLTEEDSTVEFGDSKSREEFLELVEEELVFRASEDGRKMKPDDVGGDIRNYDWKSNLQTTSQRRIKITQGFYIKNPMTYLRRGGAVWKCPWGS